MTRAHERLLAECRRLIDVKRATTGDSAHTSALSAAEWDELAITAEQQLLTPLLALAPPHDAPAEYSAFLRQRGSHVAHYNVLLLAELKRVLAALSQHGIDALTYKGPVLALDAYGAAAARSYVDADLLVRDDSIGAAIDVLQTLGYHTRHALGTNAQRLYIATYRQIPLDSARGEFVIELHTSLMPAYLPLGSPTGEWFVRRRTVVIGNVQLDTLSLEDHLLLLCMHGTKECWPHLRAVADVAGILARQSIDMTTVQQRARELNCVRALQLGLELAAWLGGSARTPTPVAGRIRQRLLSADKAPAAADEVRVVLPSLDRTRDRARFALHHVTGHTLRDWAYWPWGDRALAATRVTRPVRLAWVYATAAARKIFRMRPQG
jgi:hypothetical protein